MKLCKQIVALFAIIMVFNQLTITCISVKNKEKEKRFYKNEKRSTQCII